MSAIADPEAHFRALGGLHDAFIERFLLDADAQTLLIAVDNLNANFANPPAAAAMPATLTFVGLTELRLNVDLREGLRVGTLAVSTHADHHALALALSLGGIASEDDTWVLSARFKSVDISETR